MNLRQVGQSENQKNAKCLVKLPYSALKVHERKYLQEPHRDLKISSILTHKFNHMPYACHHNPLLNTNYSQRQDFMKKSPWKNDFDLQKRGLNIYKFQVIMAKDKLQVACPCNGARMIISTIWPDLNWIKFDGKYRSIKVHTRIIFNSWATFITNYF